MFPLYQPFQNDWISFAIFLFGIVILLVLSEIARSKFKWSVDTSRKFVHIVIGIFVLLCPFIFESRYPPVTLAAIFIIVNFAALKSKKLAAMHATERITYGTVYFPIAFLILSLFWWDRPITLEIALLLLTFADIAAALVGEHSRFPKTFVIWEDNKTVQGSITMFLTSVVLINVGTIYFHKIAGISPLDLTGVISLSLLVASMATLAEAISFKGSDNLSIPLVTAISYDLFLSSAQDGTIIFLLAWIMFSFILAYGAFRLKSLTINGSFGAFILGVFIFGIGGWKFMIPLGVFFVLSSLLSHLGGKKKESEQIKFGKGGRRDIVQVFANGGIPLLLTIWWFYNPMEWIYIAYLASIAAGTADTWGTEIGFFSKKPPRNAINFRQVEPGASGGVTLIGTIGALLGSAIIGGSGFLFLPDSSLIGYVIIAGFLASLIDSVIGASVQGIYQCSKCGRKTEKPIHCGAQATLISGFRWINNDMVNIICTLSGAVIIIILY